MGFMKTIKTRCCWRRDLAEFRGLTERERTGFLLVLEWFENFRLRYELEAGRGCGEGVLENGGRWIFLTTEGTELHGTEMMEPKLGLMLSTHYFSAGLC